MKPLPLRVASSQYDRLAEARDRTGISIQEHVRRGIDLYLGVIEAEAVQLGLMQHRFPVTTQGAIPIVGAKRIPKVSKR